jgi:hypothetical protein
MSIKLQLNQSITKWAMACLVMLVFSACGGSKSDSDEPALASYKDRILTRTILERYIPPDVTPKDSARYAEQFIDQWLKEQAVMDYALGKDAALADDVEFKVQDYRAKLIMNAWESSLMEEEMDKEVGMDAIRAYYEEKKDNFKSKDSQYNYFYIVTTSRDLNQVEDWMLSNNIEDIRKLQKWAETNTLVSKLDSSYDGEAKISEVSKGYFGSLEKADIGKLIRWNGVIQGERRRYLFKMIDVVKPGEYLPVILCKDKIRDLLLNERKITLIKSTEEKILSNARASNYIRKN